MDGAQLPFKALQVFLRHGAPAAALGLLRQRGGAGAGVSLAATGGAQGDGGQGSGLEEAGVGVAVLLESGLLAEAYMEVGWGGKFERKGPTSVLALHRGFLCGWGDSSLHTCLELCSGSWDECAVVLGGFVVGVLPVGCEQRWQLCPLLAGSTGGCSESRH